VHLRATVGLPVARSCAHTGAGGDLIHWEGSRARC